MKKGRKVRGGKKEERKGRKKERKNRKEGRGRKDITGADKKKTEICVYADVTRGHTGAVV